MDREDWQSTVHGVTRVRHNLVTKPPPWITALLWWRGLHNSMKSWAVLCKATQDRWVIVKSSDKTWSTGGGNGKQLLYSCENPMNSMKRQNIWHWKMSPSGRKMSNVLLGKNRGQLLIDTERMKQLGQSRSDAQLWMCLVVKVKSVAVENNIA